MSNELRERLQEAIGNEYEVGSELGGGVQSRVFVARDTELDRPVVIKVLPPELADGEAPDRFRREIRLVAGLQHPHVVPLLAAGEVAGLLYYTMPLVLGESIRARIDREGPQEIGLVANVMAEIASALLYAHGRGIVHRDVKPDNIFLEAESGRAMLADFGVARRMGFDACLTGGGIAVGTPAYMSPEALDGGPVDGRSDIYSLGLVAWEMLVGERPWPSETLYSMIFNQKCEPVPPINDRRNGVPPRLRRAIERSLHKDPSARWDDAEALLAYLCDATADEPRLVRRRAAPGAPGPLRPTVLPLEARPPRTITAGRLEVRWTGEWPPVPPALKEAAPRWMAAARTVIDGVTNTGRRVVHSRSRVPALILCCVLVFATGLRFARALARTGTHRPAPVETAPPTTTTTTTTTTETAPADVVTAPDVAVPVAPQVALRVAGAVVAPVASATAGAITTSSARLGRVLGTLVATFDAQGGASAVRELREAQDMWEAGRRRSCARFEDSAERARCSERLASLRADELSELLARLRRR